MERLKGHQLAREVQGGHIARQIAFTDDGEMTIDTPKLVYQRDQNQKRLKEPNGYMKNFRPFSGNQEVYDAVAAANRKSFGSGKNPPRGKSREWIAANWATIKTANSRRKSA